MQSLHFSFKTHNTELRIRSLGLALVLLISLASPTSSCTEQEKTSFLRFLAGLSWDGGLAASWRNNTDCCKWEGITCRQDSMVTKVMLASRGLEGHISESLGNLTRLQHLNLSFNDLTWQIPESICDLTDLEVLDLSSNHLTGAIPAALNGLHSLSAFNVSNNDLEGPIPSGG